MKKHIFLCAFILCLFCAMPVFAVEFTDVDGHWSKENIQYITDKGLIDGYPDGSFRPNGQITRAEFVMILAREAGVDLTSFSGKVPYSDVNDHWGASAIQWATENGVVDGYNDGRFLPDGNISRQELAVMFYRYLVKVKDNLPDATMETTPFTDDDEIGVWAKEAVYGLQATGIINGNEDGSFTPERAITRGETAKILAYYLRNVEIPEGNQVKIYVNGSLVKSNVRVETVDGMNMIQARPFVESMGYEITFYPTTKLLVVDNDSQDLQCWIGKTNAYVNGNETTLAAAPILSNENTMFPLKAMADALNVSLTENESTKSIYISCTLPSILRNANGFYGTASTQNDINGLLSLGFNDQRDGFYGTVANGNLTYGSFTTATGHRYIGNWANGTMTGSGRYISSMGELYVGTFSKGHITEGIGYLIDGATFRGTWYHNATTSATYPSVGQFTDADGITYGNASSDWSNGGLTESKW